MFSRDAEPSLRGAAERKFGASIAIALGFAAGTRQPDEPGAGSASRLNWVLKLPLFLFLHCQLLHEILMLWRRNASLQRGEHHVELAVKHRRHVEP